MTDLNAEFARIRVEFRAESLERIDGVVPRLLAAAMSGRPEPEAFESLRRELHTLKGAAGMLGLDPVHATAIACEELLAGFARDGIAAADLVDELLDGLASLRGDVVTEIPEEDSSAMRRFIVWGDPDSLIKTPRVPLEAGLGDKVLTIGSEAFELLEERIEQRLMIGAHRAPRAALGGDDPISLGLLDALNAIRMVSMGRFADGLPNAVWRLARRDNREIRLVVDGTWGSYDRRVAEVIAECASQLVGNAVLHGYEPRDQRLRAGRSEPMTVRVVADERDGMVFVTVVDDGRGISPALLADTDLARERGLDAAALDDDELLLDLLVASKAPFGDEPGRRSGLASVARAVGALGGRLEMRNVPGGGVSFMIGVPIHPGWVSVTLFGAGDWLFAIPTAAITALGPSAPESVVGVGVDPRPAVPREAKLTDLLFRDGCPESIDRADTLIRVASGARAATIAVTGPPQRMRLVRLALPKSIAALPFAESVAVRSDGAVVLVLDPEFLVHSAGAGSPEAGRAPGGEPVDDLADDAVDVGRRRAGRPRILVADDSADVRELHSTALRAAGFAVDLAADGGVALAHLRERRYSAVVTDLEMPSIDGIALTRVIREDQRWSALPVVMVSSITSRAQRAQAEAAGVTEFIEKLPGREHEVARWIVTAIEGSTGRTEDADD